MFRVFGSRQEYECGAGFRETDNDILIVALFFKSPLAAPAEELCRNIPGDL